MLYLVFKIFIQLFFAAVFFINNIKLIFKK